MAVLLLVLFPWLLLFNTPLAFAALGAAIVLLYNDRASTSRRPSDAKLDDNAV